LFLNFSDLNDIYKILNEIRKEKSVT